jgi:UDP-N-acetylmuramate dehydrogenase
LIKNTLNLPVTANSLISLPKDLKQFNSNEPFLIIGDCSNILFLENNFDGQIVKSSNDTFRVEEDDTHHIVTLGANLNWHQTIVRLMYLNINGLENLALIPGTVGAAPIQNIGAYGVEFADFCESIQFVDIRTNEVIRLNKNECLFKYRDSIFKHKYNKNYLINLVTLRIKKTWTPKLNYGISNLVNDNPSPLDVFNTICEIRTQKLPNPINLPNVGSFFKNPIVKINIANKLKEIYPDLPIYPINDDLVKLPAAYLIDKSNLKGFVINGVGTHEKQALVIVNHNSKCGINIANFAKHIKDTVNNIFNIELSPEIRFISKNEEVNADEYLNNLNPS